MKEHKKTFIGRINNLFPTCKEVTLLVVKEQEVELKALEKIKLLFHASVVCKFCRVFRKQSALLHQHVHRAAGNADGAAPGFRLSDSEKAEMQARINAHMK